MKYLILVPDGAADEKIEKLGGKTPLDVANMPTTNFLAQRGKVGLVQTIPEGVPPGSDAANLSVMGYDPSIFLTGRSPLEAASIGIDMADTDVAFRVNLITLEGEGPYENLLIKDHSGGDISTEEADELIKAVHESLGTENIEFYTGVSYRHCMIVKNGKVHYQCTPPHDVLDQKVGPHLPKGEGSEFITKMMKKSYEILKDHPVNIARIREGKNPANTIWIWGQGKKPALTSFSDKYQITGAVISAVDLIKGIAICAGLKSINIEGATGTLHTNFEGKARGTIEAFKKGLDFIYLHVEAPDECSHQGDMEGKIKSLELIDKKILKPVLEYLEGGNEEYSILVVPDHRTPLKTRTHSSDPVPFVIYRGRGKVEDYRGNVKGENCFSEESGARGQLFEGGYLLADYFFKKEEKK